LRNYTCDAFFNLEGKDRVKGTITKN
jgi:hypothetical protein